METRSRHHSRDRCRRLRGSASGRQRPTTSLKKNRRRKRRNRSTSWTHCGPRDELSIGGAASHDRCRFRRHRGRAASRNTGTLWKLPRSPMSPRQLGFNSKLSARTTTAQRPPRPIQRKLSEDVGSAPNNSCETSHLYKRGLALCASAAVPRLPKGKRGHSRKSTRNAQRRLHPAFKQPVDLSCRTGEEGGGYVSI